MAHGAPRGTNLIDGAAPFYDTYRCSDGGWLAIGALEPQFHDLLMDGLGLPRIDPVEQYDQASWPARKEEIAAVVATRTRDEWVERFEGTDACVAPALRPDEAPEHPHSVARGSFVRDAAGLPQPAPAPRFSRTPGALNEVEGVGADPVAAFTAWGFDAERAATLLGRGSVS